MQVGREVLEKRDPTRISELGCVRGAGCFRSSGCWVSSGIAEIQQDTENPEPLRRVSSVLGCPLDPVEVVSDRRMVAQLSSLLDNISHVMQETLTTLSNSFSGRIYNKDFADDYTSAD